MRIGFRVDASIRIGSGHIMRCLTLAEQLKKNGIEVDFFCRDYPEKMSVLVKERGYRLHLLPSLCAKHEGIGLDSWLGLTWQKDIEHTITAMSGEAYDCMIIDHYGIDYQWHKKLRRYVNKIMVIDDLADRQLDCDLLLDQTFGRKKDIYRSLVPDECQLMMGTNYALLKPEFADLRNRALEKRQRFNGVKYFLVFMGGSDAKNITGDVLQILDNTQWEQDVIVDVVLGSYAPHAQDVCEQAMKHSLKVNIHANVENMEVLIFDADLAIGAAGISCWERCALGLPSLIYVVAENQQKNASALELLGAAMVWNSLQELKSNIEKIQESDYSWLEMYKVSSNICDGLGCSRVINKLINYVIN